MISEYWANRYCKDDISKIENYEQAINDKENKWVIHHRLEFTLDGELVHTKQDLIRFGMYWKRPYFELIFMKDLEHRSLHAAYTKIWITDDTIAKLRNANIGKKHTEETKRKLSEIHKKLTPKINSEFGIKFKEHYGLTHRDNKKLYKLEWKWYKNHNKTCSWENE